jgi:hypothetical protein
MLPAQFRKMQNVIKNLLWRDPETARVHAVEEATLAMGGMLYWTRCGLFDVPPGRAWSGDEALTCAACRIWVDMDPYQLTGQDA